MATESTREGNYDILRILCAFLIVLLHSSAQIEGGLSYYYGKLAAVAIPLFVMLSGAFILNAQYPTYRGFYVKSLRHLGMPFLSFSLFYLFFTWFIYRFNADAFSEPPNYWIPLLRFVNGGTFYHMWYMYMLIGLYVAAPMLVRLREEIGERYFLAIAIVFSVYGSIAYCSGRPTTVLVVESAIQYVGVFMLGGWLRKHPFPFGPGLAMISYAFIVYLLHEGMLKPLVVAGYLAPLMILASAGIFATVARLAVKSVPLVAACAKGCLFVYLLHPFFLAIESRLGKIFQLDTMIPPELLVLLVAALTFVGCLLTYGLFRRLSQTWQRLSAGSQAALPGR